MKSATLCRAFERVSPILRPLWKQSIIDIIGDEEITLQSELSDRLLEDIEQKHPELLADLPMRTKEVKNYIAHEYRNYLDKIFLGNICEKLGPCQQDNFANLGHRIIFVNDRLKNITDQRNQSQTFSFFSESNIADGEIEYWFPPGANSSKLVFVINNNFQGGEGKLGTGIETVRKLRELYPRAPVLLHSAFERSEFSREELEILDSQKVKLVPKNTFYKFEETQRAKRAQAFSRIAQSNSTLCDLVTPQEIVHTDAEISLVASRKASKPNSASTYSSLLEKRLYTLSAIHSLPYDSQFETDKPYVITAERFADIFSNNLKKYQKKRELLTFTQKQEYGNLSSTISDLFLTGLRTGEGPSYHELERKYAQRKYQTITHDDAKADNWVSDSQITDLGSVRIGTPSRDIAFSLLDVIDLNKNIDDQVESAVNTYFRISREQNFKIRDKPTAQEVVELLYLDGLRLAAHKMGCDLSASYHYTQISQLARTSKYLRH
ncbi:MAG: hypothetical protein ACMXYF_01280 [Candidatus Woesearchaeota archaeon]